ncbi:MAG TPA: hypothetical protein VFZ37_14700 [Jiangellaceae bacterium]
MTGRTIGTTRGERAATAENSDRPAPRWLWFSLPIAVLAVAASITGIAVDSVYAQETENWSAQATGQDIANLVAYPAMVVLAILAARGSLRAYLGWLGTLVYSAYTYAIYAFSVQLGPLFLVYVAVFGLSVYALIGGFSSLDSACIRHAFGERAPTALTGGFLVAIGAAFYLLWLSEAVPAMLADGTPRFLREVGLPTNPVHVLDMGLLLPAALVAGVLLIRRRPWGYLLAPAVLGGIILLGVGIVAVVAVLAYRDVTTDWGVAAGIGVLVVLQLIILGRFLASVAPDATLGTALRDRSQQTPERAAR